MVPFARFAEIARAKNVPVIVDAAAEYDLRKFLREGADLVLYSAHKFLRAPTAGIVAGRRDLVRAAYMQNAGIGRGMKVGKEGIVGTLVALEAWEKTDHAARRSREQKLLELWRTALAGRAGLAVALVPDPTHNPVDRLRVTVLAPSHTTAWDLTTALMSGCPAIAVRAEALEHGYFELDPCNLDVEEARTVADRLSAELDAALARGEAGSPFADWRTRQENEVWEL
jgi:L-seryl-tRNA(Ser) seleniumtransferase